MEITPSNLPQAIAALRQCAKENKNKHTDTGKIIVSDICNDVADYLDKWVCVRELDFEGKRVVI